MANIRLIKRRIKTAKNIAQITKAMQMVAASKMKKAQVAAINGKQYAAKIQEMVRALAAKADYTHHPLLIRPSVLSGKKLVILISSNKGLCGGLNTNLFRFVSREYPDTKSVEVVTLGRKGADFSVRVGTTILADFSLSTPFTKMIPAIIELVQTKFLDHIYDSIDLVYSEFLSVVNQKPRKKTILPLSIDSVSEEQETPVNFLIEPDIKTVFNSLLPHYLENQVRDAVLQAEASEHSARMVAMKNATDNALSLTDELTLVYNKARQEKITYEINDIVTASLAASS